MGVFPGICYNTYVLNLRIVLDGTADKKFKKELMTYLRKEVGDISRRNFRMEDSKKSNEVQLADIMVKIFPEI